MSVNLGWSRFAEDFCFDHEKVRDFLPVNPRRVCAAACPANAAPGREWKPEEVAELREYNLKLGASDATVRNIDKLNDPRAAAYIAGQQPGLLTGPLYTIYKAIGVIKLSERCLGGCGVAAVPLFWIAGDDHDYEEVGSLAYRPYRSATTKQLHYNPSEGERGKPAFMFTLDAAVRELTRSYLGDFTGAPYYAESAKMISESLEQSQRWDEWFGRLLLQLLGRWGLVLFPSQFAPARRIQADLLQREIAEPGVTSDLVNDEGQKLKERGYHQQIAKTGREINFFYLDDSGYRRRILIEAPSRFVIEGSGLVFTAEELLRIAEKEPERFSPNAVLRPVVQTALFPRSACMVGPGEIAYWAQLGEVFRHFALTMPAIVPRPQMLLVDYHTRKALQRHPFKPEDYVRPTDELVIEELRMSPGSGIAGEIEIVQSGCRQKLNELARLMGESDPTVADKAKKIVANIEKEIVSLRDRALFLNKQQAELTQRHVEEIKRSFYPLGQPQDRVLNIFEFLFDYGNGLLDKINAAIDPADYGVRLLNLEEE